MELNKKLKEQYVPFLEYAEVHLLLTSLKNLN